MGLTMHFPESLSIVKMEVETWDGTEICFVNILLL